ncbi:unnamed protein product [Symbiodinium sp. CCMP2456]|nr:unnamed protein product [Symbiodinium sp. CCMP2456]
MEVFVDGTHAWNQRFAILRCMRTLRAPEARQKMDELQQKQVEDALDPPMSLILTAAAAYGAAYAGLRGPLRSRPLLLQLAACGPPAVVLSLGGLYISHRLLKSLLMRDGALTRELRSHCSELSLSSEMQGRDGK